MIQIGDVFKELRGATSEAEDEVHAALQAIKTLQEEEENLGALTDRDVETIARAAKDLDQILDFVANLNNRLSLSR